MTHTYNWKTATNAKKATKLIIGISKAENCYIQLYAIMKKNKQKLQENLDIR